MSPGEATGHSPLPEELQNRRAQGCFILPAQDIPPSCPFLVLISCLERQRWVIKICQSHHNNSFHFLIAYAVSGIQIGNYMHAFLLLTSRQGAHCISTHWRGTRKLRMIHRGTGVELESERSPTVHGVAKTQTRLSDQYTFCLISAPELPLQAPSESRAYGMAADAGNMLGRWPGARRRERRECDGEGGRDSRTATTVSKQRTVLQGPSENPRRLLLSLTPASVDLGHFSPDAHWLRAAVQGHYLLHAAR